MASLYQDFTFEVQRVDDSGSGDRAGYRYYRVQYRTDGGMWRDSVVEATSEDAAVGWVCQNAYYVYAQDRKGNQR